MLTRTDLVSTKYQAYDGEVPSRNILKIYAPKRYYHLYNRGVAKQTVFKDDLDYRVFLDYLKYALTPESELDALVGVTASWQTIVRLRRLHLAGRIELLAYCLMPNHFHLLVYQYDERAIQDLMRSVMTGYGMYFNRRYRRVGPLFQGRYKAALITEEAYLHHISRYIHLNPPLSEFEQYPYSSYGYYQEKRASWVKPGRVLDLFDGGRAAYRAFVLDYGDYKTLLDEVQSTLANS